MIRWFALLLHRARPCCRRCRWPLGNGTERLANRVHLTVFESPLLPTPGAIAPLCEPCWYVLSPEERLSFYAALWVETAPREDPRVNALAWHAIEVAVKVGG